MSIFPNCQTVSEALKVLSLYQFGPETHKGNEDEIPRTDD